jgi:ribosomal protein S18 acetylase RimI-like enzyme
MNAAVELLPVGQDDREFLYRVYASTRAEELAVVPWDDGQKDSFLRMQFDAQDAWWRENYAGTSFDVIVVDGEPAGRLYLHRGDTEIRIVDIALLPEYRGNGVGTTLLRDVIAEGKRVTIHVERMNPALRLYERLGFEIAEDKGVYLLLERQVKTAS